MNVREVVRVPRRWTRAVGCFQESGSSPREVCEGVAHVSRADKPLVRPLAFLACAFLACTTFVTLTPACGSKPQREVRDVPIPVRDVPEALRGTIGAETVLRGADPVLVSGLGIVVGLNGTGGGEIPTNISATMERELSLRGVGKGGPAGGELENVTPQQFLQSKNVAVVIVEARLAPGAPKGSRFDVFVRTMPGSSVTSLEGGRLWTTDLRIGPAAVFGARKTRKLAEAMGPIYINPFSNTLGGASLSDVESDTSGVTRTTGRVLDGGVVTEPLRLEVVLDVPSHSRARSMVNAINTRFPGVGVTGDPTARGRTGESISLEVPRAFVDRPEEFIQLVRFTRVDPSFADQAAATYVRALREQPGLARELTWCLVALGDVARKHLVQMYDYAELAPRMAALEAGAMLEDPRTVPGLIEIARAAPQTSMRVSAIELLGRMRNNPNINFALRELVDVPQLELRVAAYEALSQLRDPTINRVEIAGPDPRVPQFVVEEVPSTTPMIYVTQQGEPRIAFFGGRTGNQRATDGRLLGALNLARPVLATMWNNRLMISSEAGGAGPGGSGEVRIRFKDDRRNRVVEVGAPDKLLPFVQFLARRQTPDEPRPGLGLTYSEVVGVLFELSRQNGLTVDGADAIANVTFATEEDKLRAQVLEASTSVLSDRPEDSERAEDIAVQVFKPMTTAQPIGAASERTKTDQSMRSKIVPLEKPAPKK